MTKIVSFISIKGGVGKTTSCISVAAMAALMGRKVLVIDLDTHGAGSAIQWSRWARQLRAEDMAGFSITRDVHALDINVDGGGRLLNDAIMDAKETLGENGIILLDCQPAQSRATSLAIMHSDLVVTPCGRGGADLAGLSKTTAMINSAVAALGRDTKTKHCVLPNLMDTRSSLSSEALEAFAQSGLLVAPVIHNRVVFGAMPTMGLTPAGLKKSHPARIEAEAVTKFVLEAM